MPLRARALSALCASLAGGLFLTGLGAPPPVEAQAPPLPAGFVRTRFAEKIPQPTALAFAPDGRLFVAQQNGQLRLVTDGRLLILPFLQVTTETTGERGLLGVAPHPDFDTEPFVYVYYTVPGQPAHNRVSRFRAEGDRAVSGSEEVLLELPDLGTTTHNGGALHFGPDGCLYVAVGDNRRSDDAQSLNSPLGKILRLNADGSIPGDNPFFAQTTGQNRAIWALGFRNPYTFSFQPGTGQMYVNDVGERMFEEINRGVAGGNYGWPITEGPHQDPRFRRPLYAYNHDQGCAIVGSAFYNPERVRFPVGYVGQYFFADYCFGWVRRYDPETDRVFNFARGLLTPTDLAVGPDGALYAACQGSSSVERIAYRGVGAPMIVEQPRDRTVTAGTSATFRVEAQGSPILRYRWQRNGKNINGATGQRYTVTRAHMADNGARYRCVITNGQGRATSRAATLTVTPP